MQWLTCLRIIFLLISGHFIRCIKTINFILKSNSSTRLTSFVEGNYTVQALLTFTDCQSQCDKVSLDGLIHSYGIKYAIDSANNNTNLTRWATIGMRLDDICDNLPVAMLRGFEVISLVKNAYVCHEEFLQCSRNVQTSSVKLQRATGIIGTERSYTTIPLAALMSYLRIPMISFGASSRLLSNSDIYKSFVRTIPSDNNQVLAMLDIIEDMGWNFVFAIGSDDDYGKLAIAELEIQSRSRNICIAGIQYVPYKSVNTTFRIKEAVSNIKNTPNATAVLLFCYVSGLGDIFLKEAQEQGLQRLWLTSDAWNPNAASLNRSFVDQAHGLLAVSFKSYQIPRFTSYIENEIKTDFLCNMWLQNFLKNNFQCEPTNISSDKSMLLGPNNCSVPVNQLMDQLSKNVKRSSKLIDAVTILTRAIQKYLELSCVTGKSCSIPNIDYENLTNIVKSISFVNDEGEQIAFNNSNDPEYIFYTVENLQMNESSGSLNFVVVGGWNKTLSLDKERIQWPYWFKKKENSLYPTSRCSQACQPGQRVAAQIECCWNCDSCKNNTYSNTVMATQCLPCDNGYHTVNHVDCVVTPVFWLTYEDAEGIAIITVCSIGLILNSIACLLVYMFRGFLKTDESSVHVEFSCVLSYFCFLFGFLHIFEPTVLLCHSRNAAFVLLLMAFSVSLIMKTKITSEYLAMKAKSTLKGNLLITKVAFVSLLMLLEMASIAVWVSDSKKNVVEEEIVKNGFSIDRRCSVDFTAASLVSHFIPSILLIIATFCAIRERNIAHSFHEPMFLSFMCIALCVLMVAYFITFNFATSTLKIVIKVFTLAIFRYIHLACIILPKLYVAYLHYSQSFYSTNSVLPTGN